MLEEIKKLETAVDKKIRGEAELSKEDLESLARLLKAVKHMCSNNAYIVSFK